MGTRDPRVDAYVAESAEFARPILGHLRDVVHAACPEVEETMKWNSPHFAYKGLLCGMAAFKAHCAFRLWKRDLVVEQMGGDAEAMGQFDTITAVSDLPPKKVLNACIKAAMKLNEDGVKAPARSKPKTTQELVVPDDLREALAGDAKARATFEGFSPSHRREYLEWITGAKTQPTRDRRLKQAITWMAEGKGRNWKYSNC